ncbi:hypothetical protein IAT38_004263 [Cryptococcus sp. DSM 104549]
MSDPNDTANSTTNPLYGASPAPPTTTPEAAATSSPSPASQVVNPTGTANPLFGASPPPSQSVKPEALRGLPGSDYSPPVYHYTTPRQTSIPSSTTPTSRSLPEFLRRLTQIISIVVGASSTVAVIWSLFLLPLLHSSFSARKAIVDQQSERLTTLVEGLRRLRSKIIYPAPSSESEAGEGETEKSKELVRREASLKEINSTSSVASHHSESGDSDSAQPKPEMVPFSPLTTLCKSVRGLTSALDSTSTTRTSLISTLESYTSHLHRQLFVARPTGGYGGFSVGMGSLSANLKKEGLDSGVEGKGEEWDAARKEIRAIKGMLLNRRSFATVSAGVK